MARRASTEDQYDAELAARSARRAQEKAALAEKASQDSENQKDKSVDIAWGKKGVHALLDDDFQVESSPPAPARKYDPNADKPKGSPKADAKAQAYPVKPVGSSPASGWAPTGGTGFSSKPMSTKDIISQGSMTAAAAPTATPVSGGGSLDQAVALLGESLREERKRSAAAEERCRELEDKLEEARADLLDEKQKMVDMLKARLEVS